MQRITRLLAAAVLIATVGLVTACGGRLSGAENPPESTEDIGADLRGQVDVRPATFRPRLTRDEAIQLGLERLRGSARNIPTAQMTGAATVGKYTGDPQGPRGFVSDLPVRVVVFRPYDQSQPESQVNMVIDDATGEEIYGSVTGFRLGGPQDGQK